MTALSIRASSLPRLRLCRASAFRSKDVPYSDSPAAQRGRDMADAVANFFRIGRDQAMKQLEADPTLKAEDKKIVEDCYNLGLTLIPEGTDRLIEVEREVKLGFLGVKDGRFDWYGQATQLDTIRAALTDWKMGVGFVEDPEENAQVWGYAAGKMKELRDAGKKVDFIDGIIAQPCAWKDDQRLRSHTFSYEELKGRVSEIKKMVEEAKAPNPVATPGEHQCKWCPAKVSCPEYLAMEGGKQEVKREERAAELATVTHGTPIEVSPDEAFQTPVVILSAEVVVESLAKLELAKQMTIVDVATFQAAGLIRREISGYMNLIEDYRKKAKEPFFRFGQKIDTAAKEATRPLAEALALLDAQATAFQKAEKRKADEIAKAKAEEEAKAKAQAEEIERKRKAEEEALARAEEAKRQAENSKGKTKSAASARADELLAQAEADRKERERLEQAQREAAVKKSEEQAVAPAAVPTSTLGFATRTKLVFTVPDFSRVPKEFANQILLLDEKVVAALHKSKKIPETAIQSEKNPEGWLVVTEELKTGGGR